MLKRLQFRGANDHAQPLWQRALVIACLFLVTFASSVQAVHIHGEWMPHHAAQVGAPADLSQPQGGEEHCPLCVAMHSALPVAVATPIISIALEQPIRVVEAMDRVPETQWHFDLFSRPPPATQIL